MCFIRRLHSRQCSESKLIDVPNLPDGFYARKGTFEYSPEHDILVCGYEHVERGWTAECRCGFVTNVMPLLELVGIEMDDHFRQMGLLID